jgi:hypothetical protein
MGVMKIVYKGLFGKPEEKRPLKDLGIDVSIILRWILGKWNRDHWLVVVNVVMNSWFYRKKGNFLTV